MSATTPAKRESKHVSSGGDHLPKSWGLIIAGGTIFITAWIIWTFWYATPLASM